MQTLAPKLPTQTLVPMTEGQAALIPGLTTIDEEWQLTVLPETHVYGASCGFVKDRLGRGDSRKCLAVGSPIFEVVQLEWIGWDMTYLDVRRPPMGGLNYVQGDALSLPFPDKTFDALTSTCVLCHVGLGRYGDEVCLDGDRVALGEFVRVLKPGGRAAINFGPGVMGLAQTMQLGRVHRIYSTNSVMDMVVFAGLNPLDAAVWKQDHGWLSIADLDATASRDIKQFNESGKVEYAYFMMLLEKP